MSAPEHSSEFKGVIGPVLAAEMAESAERGLQLALFFADKHIAQGVIDERFKDMMSGVNGREMLYEDALTMRYVELAARTQLTGSARQSSARNLASRALHEKYGFSDEEVDYVLTRKIQQEQARNSSSAPRHE